MARPRDAGGMLPPSTVRAWPVGPEGGAMAVPATVRVTAAMDAVGAGAPADVARLAVYRLLRVELGRQRGLSVGLLVGVAEGAAQEALALLRVEAPDPRTDDV